MGEDNKKLTGYPSIDKPWLIMMKKLFSFLSILVSIAAVISAVFSVISFFKNEKYRNEEKVSEMLEVAENYYLCGDYEALAMTYSNELLKDNPKVLLNIGVMYANGIYYAQDYSMAENYFKLAMSKGEEGYSLINLIQLLSYEEMDRIQELIESVCNSNNSFCEKLLCDLYTECNLKCDGKYIDDYRKRSETEKTEILKSMFVCLGEYTYEVAVEYEYVGNDTMNEEEGDYDISAIPKVEERNVDIYIKKKHYGKSEIRMIFD